MYLKNKEWNLFCEVFFFFLKFNVMTIIQLIFFFLLYFISFRIKLHSKSFWSSLTTAPITAVRSLLSGKYTRMNVAMCSQVAVEN